MNTNTETVEAGSAIKEFENKKLQALSELITQEGVITVEKPGPKPEIKVDTQKAIQILSPHYQEIRPHEIDRHQAESSYRSVVKAFVDNGIIDTEVAQLTGKLIRPSDIAITNDKNFWAFLYLRSDFPKGQEKRGELVADGLLFTARINSMKSVLSQAGVSLPDEQIEEIVRRWIISHEYGHAVDAAIRINEAKKPGRDEWLVPRQMDEDIYEHIARNPKLESIVAEGDGSSSSLERVSTGFEALGLRFALKEAGVESEKVDEVIGLLRAKDARNATELEETIKITKSKGMTRESLDQLLTAVIIGVRGAGKKELTRVLPVPLPPQNFCASYAGYFFPMSEEELKEYINKYK